METKPHRSPSAETENKEVVDFFRAELSAVETYELALKSINHVGLHRTLQEILSSHARRRDQLQTALGRRGVQGPRGSGVWGAFAKTLQAGADLLGDRAAIALLEQGEDRILELYKQKAHGLGPHDAAADREGSSPRAATHARTLPQSEELRRFPELSIER